MPQQNQDNSDLVQFLSIKKVTVAPEKIEVKTPPDIIESIVSNDGVTGSAAFTVKRIISKMRVEEPEN